MTRKDYELVAGLIARARRQGKTPVPTELISSSALAYALADALAADNPRFDRDRFTAAALDIPNERNA